MEEAGLVRCCRIIPGGSLTLGEEWVEGEPGVWTELESGGGEKWLHSGQIGKVTPTGYAGVWMAGASPMGRALSYSGSTGPPAGRNEDEGDYREKRLGG